MGYSQCTSGSLILRWREKVVGGGGDGRAPTSDTSWDEDGNPARNSDVLVCRGEKEREDENRARTHTHTPQVDMKEKRKRAFW